jgi:hypothetical protein
MNKEGKLMKRKLPGYLLALSVLFGGNGKRAAFLHYFGSANVT